METIFPKIFTILVFVVIIVTTVELLRSNEDVIWPKPADPLMKYVKIHQEVVDKRREMRVVFSGEIRPGYANRVYSVVTSLVAGVFTDSAVLIKWKAVEHLIEAPLPRCFDNFESQTGLNYNFRPSEIVALPGGSDSSWSSEKKLSSYVSYSLPKAARVQFQSNTAFFFNLCSNPAYFPKIIEYNLSSQVTLEKANQSLNDPSMPEHERVENVLMLGFEVGARLLRRFWRPKYVIQKIVDDYLVNKFRGFFMIGIHLRYQYINDDDVLKFAECALRIERETHENGKTKWFVSSDSWKVLATLEKKYKSRVILGEGKLGHSTHFPDTLSRAILDNELLSRCDRLIITGGSSFGFVAAMKAFEIPYFVEGKRNVSSCQRMRFHRPPRNLQGTSIF